MPQQLTAPAQRRNSPLYMYLGHRDCFSQGQQVALAADEFGFEGPHYPQDTLQTPLHANILSANEHHYCLLSTNIDTNVTLFVPNLPVLNINVEAC